MQVATSKSVQMGALKGHDFGIDGVWAVSVCCGVWCSRGPSSDHCHGLRYGQESRPPAPVKEGAIGLQNFRSCSAIFHSLPSMTPCLERRDGALLYRSQEIGVPEAQVDHVGGQDHSLES